MRILAFATVLLFASGLQSQVPGPPTRTVTFGNSGVAFSPRPVTGAPYSAQQVSEHTQTLADGTHINDKPRIAKLYRDSEGRTRTERPIFAGPNWASDDVPVTVEIRDPVAGFQYTLDMQAKVAHRVAMTTPPGAARPGSATETISAGAPPPPPPAPPIASGNTSFTTVNSGQRVQHTSESLGTQTIEGVLVQGRKITTTVPAGAEGNDQPMVSTSENWFSPDLKTFVLFKSSNPRSGENVTRLQNIVLGEPDPSLFVPPSDFTIVDEKGPFQIRYQFQPAQAK